MLVILRLLIAGLVLLFYLPVISGVALAIVDASGWTAGALSSLWKYTGELLSEALGFSTSFKEDLFIVWGLAALLSVIGHALLSIVRVGRDRLA
jgi:hypothetical protein